MIIAVKKIIIRGKQFRSRSHLTSRSGMTFQVRPDIGLNVMLRLSADDNGGQKYMLLSPTNLPISYNFHMWK